MTIHFESVPLIRGCTTMTIPVRSGGGIVYLATPEGFGLEDLDFLRRYLDLLEQVLRYDLEQAEKNNSLPASE